MMSIKEKLSKAKESTWLSEQFTYEERITAKYIAQISTVIQEQRKVKGYTQKELAKKLGVSQVMISRWENGEENFTITTLVKISTALGIKLYNPLDKSNYMTAQEDFIESKVSDVVAEYKQKQGG